LGKKFDPDAVTVVPMFPLVGFSAIDCTITVKDVVSELPLASVILIVLTPAVEGGTTKVALENEPVASVTTVDGEVETIVPANVTEIGELAANPVPEAATDVPLGPLDGLVMRFGVTVKLATAALWLIALSVTVTVWIPAAA
jgi:hypothetical protein